MMHRMNQPTARQNVDKCPSITHVLSLAFVVAEPGFFLKIYEACFRLQLTVSTQPLVVVG